LGEYRSLHRRKGQLEREPVMMNLIGPGHG
jgi:hypothetical protein